MSNNNLTQFERDQLIFKYIKVVYSIANNIHKKFKYNILKEDLISVGTIGLIEAIDKYNPELKKHFYAYVRKRIWGAIIDNLRTEDAYSVKARGIKRLWDSTEAKLEHIYLSKIDSEILAKELNISLDEYNSFFVEFPQTSRHMNIEDLRKPEGINSVDVFELQDYNTPEQELDTLILLNKIREILIKTSDREQLIFTLYYYNGLSLPEISTLLDLTISRLSQLLTGVVEKIKRGVDGLQ